MDPIKKLIKSVGNVGIGRRAFPAGWGGGN
jgi:hypothetical protein